MHFLEAFRLWFASIITWKNDRFPREMFFDGEKVFSAERESDDYSSRKEKKQERKNTSGI